MIDEQYWDAVRLSVGPEAKQHFQAIDDPLWNAVEANTYGDTTFDFYTSELAKTKSARFGLLGALPNPQRFIATRFRLRPSPQWSAESLAALCPLACFEFYVANKEFQDLPLDLVLDDGTARYHGRALEQPLLIEPSTGLRAVIRWRNEDAKKRLTLLLVLDGVLFRPVA